MEKTEQDFEYFRPPLILRARVFLIPVRSWATTENKQTNQQIKSNYKTLSKKMAVQACFGNMTVVCREGGRFYYGILKKILEDDLSG
ncbi:MAG: hypothetical protein KDA77_03535 [Planctomycetaceae bacterium]|nr:hypothetical protein [Planctomycetaceae bacterium]